MIRNKYLSYFLAIINIVFIIILTFYKDPLIYNYSMFSKEVKGHLILIVFCLILGINLANTTFLLDKNKTLLALISPLIASIFPYRNNGDLSSNLHEICAYISFGLVMFITLNNISKYKTYNYKKASIIEEIFIFVFILDGLIYLKLLGVTSIQEFILLTMIIIIHLYLYVELMKKS